MSRNWAHWPWFWWLGGDGPLVGESLAMIWDGIGCIDRPSVTMIDPGCALLGRDWAVTGPTGRDWAVLGRGLAEIGRG